MYFCFVTSANVISANCIDDMLFLKFSFPIFFNCLCCPVIIPLDGLASKLYVDEMIGDIDVLLDSIADESEAI